MKELITEFWQAVAQDAPYLRMASVNFRNTEPVVKYLMDILADIHESLSFILTEKKGQLTLTITAQGDPEAFIYVSQVVASAPEIKGLKVIKFSQPATKEEIESWIIPFRLEDISIDLQQMYFNYIELEDEDGLLILAFREYNKYKEHPKLSEALYYILDDVLGEMLHSKLGLYFLEIPDQDPEDVYLGKISELPDFLADL